MRKCKTLGLLNSLLSYVPQLAVVQSLSHVWLFVTPWIAACQTSLPFAISWSLLKLMSMESVMPSNHLILYCPLLFLPSVFPSIGVFSSESALYIKWLSYHGPNPVSSFIRNDRWLLLAFLQLLSNHCRGGAAVAASVGLHFWESSFTFGGQKSLTTVIFLVYWYGRRYFHFTIVLWKKYMINI